MAVDLSKVNRPARAAARAEHVEPRRPRDQRGPDRRRPQHVAAGGKLLVPALDDGLRLGARGSVGNLPLLAGGLGRRVRGLSLSGGLARSLDEYQGRIAIGGSS